MTSTDPLNLDAIETRANAATPGPWRDADTHLGRHGHTATVLSGTGNDTDLRAWLPSLSQEAWDETRNVWADAAFVAAARTDVPELLAEVRRLRAEQPEVEPEAIHGHFGLTYANYLVLPRTLLQSMDDGWQTRFVALLDELHEAFRHVPQADAYKVEAAEEHTVSEMSAAQLRQAGITEDWYGGETPPEGLSGDELAEWQNRHEQPGPDYYDADGNELDEHGRVLLPVADPVPHYGRGRTRIAPAVVPAR